MKTQKSITKNFMYNIIRTTMSLLFPVITFSYASRILGKSGIGKVNFATAIVSYFILFASLGISNYGIREGARVRDNKEKFSKLVHELFLINLITTGITYGMFFLMIIFVPAVEGYEKILVISGLSIGLTSLGVEWLYTAVEDYEYITIRQIIVQILAIVMLLVLVRESEDYLQYAFILVFATCGANIFNLIHAKKYISLKIYHKYELKKHLRPIFVLFAYTISVNLYNNLDSIMLGVQIGDIEVGIYSAAVKMNRMVVTMLSSLGMVLVPRLSYYLENNENSQFEALIKKSLHFVLMFSIPAAVGINVLSKEVITIFSGNGFGESALTLKVLSPIIIIIPITTLVNSQILIPNKKENKVVITTLVGVVVNVILNYLLIPYYGANGAGIASVIAEFMVMCTALILVRKIHPMRTAFEGIAQYIIASISIIVISFFIHMIFENIFIIMGSTIVLSLISYFSILLVFKNIYIKDILCRLLKRRCDE